MNKLFESIDMAGADDGVFGPTQYELGSVSACTRCSLMAARVLLMDQSLFENSWAFFEGISAEAMMYPSVVCLTLPWEQLSSNRMKIPLISIEGIFLIFHIADVYFLLSGTSK
jgi:hypothetical protein